VRSVGVERRSGGSVRAGIAAAKGQQSAQHRRRAAAAGGRSGLAANEANSDNKGFTFTSTEANPLTAVYPLSSTSRANGRVDLPSTTSHRHLE
jgi:hypothetical protein